MTQGPPGGWEQYPTNTDLQALATKMAEGFNEAGTERKILRTDMNAGFAAAETDRKNIRTDMNAGFTAADAKMTAGFAAADAKTENLRAEMYGGLAQTNAKIDGLGADVKTALAELAGTRSRDVWAFSATVAVLALMFTVAVIIGA
ncbi:MAG: hypothetical protein OXB92_04610 [Acidimicrobiaceae bacterium]|nr:hypothetical protein [Acidimicrobiaceae bacterium]